MYLVGLGHVHEGGVKGDLLFFLGAENGSQVYSLFHGADEFFPAIHVSGIVDLADPNKDVGNIKRRRLPRKEIPCFGQERTCPGWSSGLYPRRECPFSHP